MTRIWKFGLTLIRIYHTSLLISYTLILACDSQHIYQKAIVKYEQDKTLLSVS